MGVFANLRRSKLAEFFVFLQVPRQMLFLRSYSIMVKNESGLNMVCTRIVSVAILLQKYPLARMMTL